MTPLRTAAWTGRPPFTSGFAMSRRCSGDAYERSASLFFLALGLPLGLVICIGAAFGGRFGKRLGLVVLAFGLAGLPCGALSFTACRDGYGLFAWVLLMPAAGGVTCFGGASGSWHASSGKRTHLPP